VRRDIAGKADDFANSPDRLLSDFVDPAFARDDQAADLAHRLAGLLGLARQRLRVCRHLGGE
jgi:hypothetical protein